MNIMEEKLLCIKPENPCMEWYDFYDDLFDEYWHEKSIMQIKKEASEKACKNCRRIRACHPMK